MDNNKLAFEDWGLTWKLLEEIEFEDAWVRQTNETIKRNAEARSRASTSQPQVPQEEDLLDDDDDDTDLY